jgi:hypothetical protein
MYVPHVEANVDSSPETFAILSKSPQRKLLESNRCYLDLSNPIAEVESRVASTMGLPKLRGLEEEM